MGALFEEPGGGALFEEPGGGALFEEPGGGALFEEPGGGLVYRGLRELDEGALGMGHRSVKRLHGGGLR